MIEKAKFTYSPLKKALEKQSRTIEDQDKKQIKAIENHGKQLGESNELTKKILISTEIAYHLKSKKNI